MRAFPRTVSTSVMLTVALAVATLAAAGPATASTSAGPLGDPGTGATGVDIPATATPAPTATPSAGKEKAADICNKYCDARDPGEASDARLVATADAADGRQLELRMADGDDMGWATITHGGAGDEVWLDRSFDGGRTWSSGSKLGDTVAPSGQQDWRTLMYNVDDWNNAGYGLLRACGLPQGASSVSCTGWARSTWNAGTRSTAAATALMEYYNGGTGLFDTTGWWNSANALTALIDNVRVSGMDSYRYAIDQTYRLNLQAQRGDFTNDYLDDTGWWGLAWIDAYDLTGDSKYLDTARIDADYLHSYWDSTCGGGIWWSVEKTYKNAIANSLYIELNAALHNRIDGDTGYLERARDGWSWFTDSGMINDSNLVNDGIDLDTCTNNGGQVYTYNQGVPLAALAELHRATGDDALLTTARTLADASTTSTSLNSDGILHDPGDSPGGGGNDGPSFKGVYARDLGALNAALSDHPYTEYLQRQADSAYANDRNTADQYGLLWAGPFDQSDAARQQSALDLMNATN
ncbi:glycoside hydrolase family 76 protein [Amycolatopsis jiangsuensis]|uniref:Putative alpha-1,6-mannanase (GH76 family) n=1 Tax=Amycolatopsis jiangsuensis TaxID=1181879 RepID=A0A840IYB9_9PSEU|nr:glycoside hydrolase family 76 protein [Amycolatopsis jiangsuensis]MBB4686693.1 putative alpha-1,6-mannanase (GH76 family) [Amycolatopsis jiangsuensis]